MAMPHLLASLHSRCPHGVTITALGWPSLQKSVCPHSSVLRRIPGSATESPTTNLDPEFSQRSHIQGHYARR